MILAEVSTLHISADGMDAHAWVAFAIVLGPALLMMVVVALRVRHDAREEDLRDALGATGQLPRRRGEGPVRSSDGL